MLNKEFQWYAFQEVNKAIPHLGNYNAETKALTALTYFALIGEVASEANLIRLLQYVGLDFEDKAHQEAILEIIQYYCGAGIIRIIDNGLGMKQHFSDRESDSFQKGKNANMSPWLETLMEAREEIQERINGGRVKDGERDRDS